MGKPRHWIVVQGMLALLIITCLGWCVAAPVELTLLAHTNYKVAFDELIARYNTLQDDFLIQAIYIAGDTLVQEKFVGMAVGGVVPDILWHYNASEFAAMGLVVPLDDFIAQEDDRDGFVKDFIGDVTKRYTYQNQLYALPFGVNTGYMVIYNKDKFAEGGVADPTDGWQWDEFLHSSRRLTLSSADGVVEQWGFDTPSEVFFPWVYSVGSEPFDPVKQQWYSDRSATVEALDHAVSLVREYRVTPFPLRGWKKFTDGTSAMYAEGNYVYGWMKTTDSLQSDVGVVNWPVVNARKIYLGGYGLFLGRTGDEKREKAAWEFTKWAIQPEQQLLYTTISKQLPSTLSTIQHADFWEWMMENPIVAGFMTEASTYGTPQYVPIGYVDVLNLTMEWAYDGLKGTMPVETAVDNLLKDISVMYSNMTGPII